jgi:phosphopantothenoylcysteine synthetase/decarboxylase
MNILVTAGNTLTLIDKVRGITNIFTGRTGAFLALEAHRRGHRVTLLTSHPEAVETPPADDRWALRRFRTFEDLHQRLQELILAGGFDAIVHCAAVSDYRSAGVYAPAPATHFDPNTAAWHSEEGPPALIDRASGQVKSDEEELWLRLVRTPKLIDLFRSPWGFQGVLVKFKLEVGKVVAELEAIAERSRTQSQADLMVANTLEGASFWALLGPVNGQYELISRRDLAGRLLESVERLHQERSHG